MIESLNFQQNLQKFAGKFKETADLAWLIRYAQEADLSKRLLPKVKPGKYQPLQLADFLEALADREVLAEADPIQAELNWAAGQVLVEAHNDDPERLRPLVGISGTISECLNPQLLPDAVQMSAILDKLIETAEGLPETQRRLVLPKLDAKMAARVANRVLGKICAELIEKNLWLNPVLLFLPRQRAAEFVKQASTNQGPRLSDLIRALQICVGRFTVEMLATKEKLDRASAPRDRGSLQTTIFQTSRKIVVLDAYIDFLQRAQAGLAAVMASDPSKIRMRYSNGDLVSPDPFVAPNFSEAKTIRDLVRPADQKIAFETVMWDGSKEQISGFQMPQTKIVDLYMTFVMEKDPESGEPAFIDHIVRRMTENAYLYKNEYAKEGHRLDRIKELSKIFAGADQLFLSNLYEELIGAVERAEVVPTEEELQQGHDDIAQVRFMQGQGIDYSDLIGQHKQRQEQALKDAAAVFASKYEPQAAMKGIMLEQNIYRLMKQVADNDVLAIGPADVRFLKTLGDLKYGSKKFDYSLPPDTAEISALAKAAIPDIKTVLGSRQFRAQYLTNDRVYNEWAKQIVDEENPVKKSIEEGKKFLETPEGHKILQRIGFNPEIWKQLRQEKGSKAEFESMLNVVFAKNQKELQDTLGNVPLDSLYAYLGTNFANAKIESLTRKIAHRWTGETGPEQQTAPGVAKTPKTRHSEAEAERYLNEWFLPISLQRGKSDRTNLRPWDTAGGLMAIWHTEPKAKVGKKGQRVPFEGFFASKTSQGFGNFLKKKTREKIDAILDLNKKESEEARKEGREFDWRSAEKPRDTRELMEVIGAFADPIPGKTMLGGRKKFREDSQEILPGERLTQEQLDQLKAAGMPAPDTAEKHYERMRDRLAKIGLSMGEEIGQLRDGFRRRKQEVLEIDSRYARDIIPFKVPKSKDDTEAKKTMNPFVHVGFYADAEAETGPIKHSYIATPQEAIEWIETLVPSLVSPDQFRKIEARFKAVYPRFGLVVWPSQTKFLNFLEETLAPIIDDQEKLQEILHKLDPSRKISPKAVEEVMDAKPATVRRKPEKTLIPGVLPVVEGPLAKPNEKNAKILEEIQKLMVQVVQGLETKIGTTEDEQEQAFLRLDDVDKKVSSELRKIKLLKSNDQLVISAMNGLEVKLHELRALKAETKTALDENQGLRAAQLRVKKILPLLERIQKAVSSAPSWQENNALQINDLISSLINGSPDQLVRPTMIDYAAADLEKFAELVEDLQQARNKKSMTPQERKRLGPNVEGAAVDQLKAALARHRESGEFDFEAGPSYGEEQIERYDLGKTFDKE